MCSHHQHKENKDFTQDKKYRLADFFNMWWDDYCQHPTEFIRPEQYKAVNAIRVCRTEVLGVDYYACPDCGEISEVRHSCKNRFCPTCSWKDTVKWADKLALKIFDVPHRHCVFTLPHSLNGLIKNNKKETLNIPGRISADTFKSWFKEKYNLKIGIVSVIHTYGEKKNAHYHIHMIVSWGGTDFKTGELIKLEGKEKAYVNYNHLKKEFRRKYINELDKSYKNGDLESDFSAKEFHVFKKKLHKNKWQIHLEAPMETAVDVIRYIGRYSKRACLSEYKITNIEGEYISFRYRDYVESDESGHAKEKEMRLHYSKFFPLLLQHVPPPYFRLVRYYGIYARFDQIPQEYRATEDNNLSDIIEQEYKTDDTNPKYCAACTVAKQYVYTLIDKRLKAERTEPFDINKHKHVIYKKQYFDTEKQVIRNAA